MKQIILKIRNFFNKEESDKSNDDGNEETLKFNITKGYIEIDYEGQIAKFWGDLWMDRFAAIASSMEWVRHTGDLRDGEQMELMRAVYDYCEKHKGCRVRVCFYDDDKNEITF